MPTRPVHWWQMVNIAIACSRFGVFHVWFNDMKVINDFYLVYVAPTPTCTKTFIHYVYVQIIYTAVYVVYISAVRCNWSILSSRKYHMYMFTWCGNDKCISSFSAEIRYRKQHIFRPHILINIQSSVWFVKHIHVAYIITIREHNRWSRRSEEKAMVDHIASKRENVRKALLSLSSPQTTDTNTTDETNTTRKRSTIQPTLDGKQRTSYFRNADAFAQIM